MKKNIIGLILILFSNDYSMAQVASVNSLKDCSYLLVLTKKVTENNYNVTGIGTGFFVRNKKDLYLVSANHVFTGNDPIKGIRVDSTSPDLMVFHYEIKDKKEKGFKNIYLDSIKARNPPKLVSESPDILAYKIDLPLNSKIKTIDAFIEEKVNLKPGDSLFFWGYPSQQHNSDMAIRQYLINPEAIIYRGAFQKAEDSLNYMATPTTKFGASGSPVFVRKIIKGKERIIFIGVMSSASDAHNVSYFVNFKALLSQIH